jgi:hypothetical protein
MSQKAFEQFRSLVLKEPMLQKEVRYLTGDEFVVRVVELGADDGFEFTTDDVLAAMRENKRLWIERWI